MKKYQGEKSHVGYTNCYFCGEIADILIHKRFAKKLTANMGVMDAEPCGKCKDLMKQGVILMSIKNDTTDEQMQGREIRHPRSNRLVGYQPPNPYRTGGWVVVKDEAVENMFDEAHAKWALRNRYCFITDKAWDALGIPRGEVEGVPNE